jgi:hypothetical protein
MVVKQKLGGTGGVNPNRHQICQGAKERGLYGHSHKWQRTLGLEAHPLLQG